MYGTKLGSHDKHSSVSASPADTWRTQVSFSARMARGRRRAAASVAGVHHR